MAKMGDLLSSRFELKSERPSKMGSLADRSSSGGLSSFSGVFRVNPLNGEEEQTLMALLQSYEKGEGKHLGDLPALSTLTAELKAIHNQAAVLHGERIFRAREILKSYKEGAFTAWLIAIYGNRQTPYNFLRYYELYAPLSKPLQETVDQMPRQAIYTLASRSYPIEAKEDWIAQYNGQTKQELLEQIRKLFPLDRRDRRKSNPLSQLLSKLKEVEITLSSCHLTKQEKQQLTEALQSIQRHL